LADGFRVLLARLIDCRVSSVVRVKLVVGPNWAALSHKLSGAAQLSTERSGCILTS
jgi:hypothetical protein